MWNFWRPTCNFLCREKNCDRLRAPNRCQPNPRAGACEPACRYTIGRSFFRSFAGGYQESAASFTKISNGNGKNRHHRRQSHAAKASARGGNQRCKLAGSGDSLHSLVPAPAAGYDR